MYITYFQVYVIVGKKRGSDIRLRCCVHLCVHSIYYVCHTTLLNLRSTAGAALHCQCTTTSTMHYYAVSIFINESYLFIFLLIMESKALAA